MVGGTVSPRVICPHPNPPTCDHDSSGNRVCAGTIRLRGGLKGTDIAPRGTTRQSQRPQARGRPGWPYLQALGEDSTVPRPGPQTHGRQDGREPGPAVSGSRGPLSPHCRKHLGPNFRPRPIASYEPMLPPTSDLKTKPAFPILTQVASPPRQPVSCPQGHGGDLPWPDCAPRTRTSPGRLVVPIAVIPPSMLFPKATLFSTVREGALGPGPQSCYGKPAETGTEAVVSPFEKATRTHHAGRTVGRQGTLTAPARTGAGVRTGHWGPWLDPDAVPIGESWGCWAPPAPVQVRPGLEAPLTQVT